MYITDVVWWGYTTYLVILIAFMLWFANAVREKEG